MWVRVNCWNKLAAQYVRKGPLVQVMAEWIDQSGTPQPSLGINASHLVLLDRLVNDESENGGDISF